jgi:hypothetical protein
MRKVLRALTAFDWISPIIHTVDDATHGFGGHPIFVNERQLEAAKAVLAGTGINSWSAERYGPFSSEASITVNDADYQTARWNLEQAGIKITR